MCWQACIQNNVWNELLPTCASVGVSLRGKAGPVWHIASDGPAVVIRHSCKKLGRQVEAQASWVKAQAGWVKEVKGIEGERAPHAVSLGDAGINPLCPSYVEVQMYGLHRSPLVCPQCAVIMTLWTMKHNTCPYHGGGCRATVQTSHFCISNVPFPRFKSPIPACHKSHFCVWMVPFQRVKCRIPAFQMSHFCISNVQFLCFNCHNGTFETQKGDLRNAEMEP